MDALSQVLAAVRLESTILSHFVLRAPWGLHCPAMQAIPFYAVIEGNAWLWIEDAAPTLMHPGDLVVLPTGQANTIASAPAARVVSLLDALAARKMPIWTPGDEPSIVEFEYGGRGRVTRILAGVFHARSRDNPLTRELPPVIRLNGADAHMLPLLQAALRFVADECRERAPGATVAAARLADLIFLQVLRSHWSRPEAGSPGLLRGLADARIRRALEAMHRAPEDPWTVPRLARVAGMSRSSFADHFQQRVGASPKVYLTRWRMQLAAERLATTRAPTARIAEELGYRSPFAFAKCFRRMHGVAPGRYRRQQSARAD